MIVYNGAHYPITIYKEKLMKKLVSAALFASFTLPHLANAYPNCDQFYLQFRYLLLTPTGTNVDLNSEDINTADATNGIFNSNLLTFDPKDHSAYEINLGYAFAKRPDDFVLSYLHFNSKDRLPADLSDNPFSIASFYITNVLLLTSGPVALTELESRGKLHYYFDRLSLNWGKLYQDCFGAVNFHPTIGIQYASLKHRFSVPSDAVITVMDTPLATDIEIDANSSYQGVGPAFGLDLCYQLIKGFGLVSHIDASLLVGAVKSNTELTMSFEDPELANTIGVTLTSVDQCFSKQSAERVVTALSGKLGVDYSLCFCGSRKLRVEVGYQVSKYYDVFDLIRGDAVSPFNSSTAQKITDTITDNFDIRGPYASLSLSF